MISGSFHDGWSILKFLSRVGGFCDQYHVTHDDGREGFLRYYDSGVEPDMQVYDVLQKQISYLHVPHFITTGHFQGRAYIITERLTDETLADLGIVLHNLPQLCDVVRELGEALNALSEAGVRHRGIAPNVLIVRTKEPLDFVITGFESACLSEYDLEVVAPLRQSVYMAPEAVMGAVTPASDWWSLGMVLLEQVTEGACFKERETYPFLLHMLTYGIDVPVGLNLFVHELLTGLLTQDHTARWKWPDVQAWLERTTQHIEHSKQEEDGGTLSNAPQVWVENDLPLKKFIETVIIKDIKKREDLSDLAAKKNLLPIIKLGEKIYDNPAEFALAAASRANWEQSLKLLKNGALTTWVESFKEVIKNHWWVDHFNKQKEGDVDDLLMKVLKLLNPKMPFVYKGELITPLWFMNNMQKAYDMFTYSWYSWNVEGWENTWYKRLHQRIQRIRQRAANLHIKLNEEQLKSYLLCTSHALLLARAHEQCLAYPDAQNAGVLSLLERRNASSEDLIVLLSAEKSQFISAENVVVQASELLKKCHIALNAEQLNSYVSLSRFELYDMLDERTQKMAVTGHTQLDAWIEKYRLEKRMPIAHLLVLLMYPQDQWLPPQKHQYTLNLLNFFEKKVAFSGLIGPLVRMRIGRSSSRIDLCALNHDQIDVDGEAYQLKSLKKEIDVLREQGDAKADEREKEYRSLYYGEFYDRTRYDNEKSGDADLLIKHILARSSKGLKIFFQPTVWETYAQMSALESDADLYKRDTGINGLYMGFPFVLYQEPHSQRLPRIAPIFLWPICLSKQMDANGVGTISAAFDAEREEVRINPALENIFSKETAQEWLGILNDLMRQPTLFVKDVMERFSPIGKVWEMDRLLQLPTEFNLQEGKPEFVPSAVMFMVNFTGQAVGADLKALKELPLAGSALETVLKLGGSEDTSITSEITSSQSDQYWVAASDPSQEAAVLQARQSSGVLIEGPPGTGKSQTIVNLVADSLGRSETMLIICQKKAALDVVYKRLVAEGLASRIMMVGDINADRNATLRLIREQLEEIKQQDATAIEHFKVLRETLSTRVRALEQKLDAYHEGLHTADVQTGLSYREIVTELIRLSKEKSDLTLEVLQPFVSGLSQKELLQLKTEVCPILALWLAACYEGSPFEHLRSFSNDAMTFGSFKREFDEFLRVAQEVEQAQQARPTPVQVKSDPQAFREWMAEHIDALIQITGEARQQLMRWMPLFQTALPGQAPDAAGQTVGGDLLAKFKHLVRLLQEVPFAQWQDRYSPQMALIEDAALTTLEKQASVVTSPRPWYAFLSFSRKRYRKAVLQQLEAWGAPMRESLDEQVGLLAFRDALRLEQEARPLRKELQLICEALKLLVPSDDSGPELLVYAQNCFYALTQVQQWVDAVNAFPDPHALTLVIRGGDVHALQRLRTDYEAAFVHYALRQKWLQTLEALHPYFSDYLMEECRYAIRHYVDLPVVIAQMKESWSELSAYLAYRDKVPHLSRESKALLAELRTLREDLLRIPPARLADAFACTLQKEALLIWKARIERINPSLLQTRADWESSIIELEKVDLEMRQLNRDSLVQMDMNKIATRKQWEDITRLRGEKALRLREFIEQGAALGLMHLRPIWLLNPDVASRLLPLEAGLFDTVVYDEASQMSVEFALPTLFRGKRVVVSGDEKQMPPSSFFTAQVEVDEEDMLSEEVVHGNIGDDEWDEAQANWNKREIQDCPDLLQLARTVLPGRTLQIHYRSAYRELIAFSNAAFYAAQLNVPVRHTQEEVFKAKPIELIEVNGVYEDQRNEEEAQQVVEQLAKLWAKPLEERPSVGIVTFNKKQASLIERMLYQYAGKNQAFEKAFMQERKRLEGGEDMSVFVKNVENVQGDERDVIIFSTTFGYNKEGIFRRNFGVLGQQGGERRLNVGITRAKQKVILLSSMPIDDISDMLTTQRAPRAPRDYLQGYLAYARFLSQGQNQAAEQILKRMALSYSSLNAESAKNSDGLQDAIEAYLVELGVRYQRGSGADAFYLDFVIEDPSTGEYVLGIECDAPCHPLLAHARAREIWRPKVLGRIMKDIHRIVSCDWLEHAQEEKERLKNVLDRVLKKSGENER